jgi:hypothetical protein
MKRLLTYIRRLWFRQAKIIALCEENKSNIARVENMLKLILEDTQELVSSQAMSPAPYEKPLAINRANQPRLNALYGMTSREALKLTKRERVQLIKLITNAADDLSV